MSEVGGAHSNRGYDAMTEKLTKVDSAMVTRASKTETMKAVRFHGKRDLRYEDIPNPECGRGQVKIKPAWCGICGSGKFRNWSFLLLLLLLLLLSSSFVACLARR